MLTIKAYTFKMRRPKFTIENKLGLKLQISKERLIDYKAVIPWAILFINDKEVDFKDFVDKLKIDIK